MIRKTFSSENLKRIYRLRYLAVDGRIILKWICRSIGFEHLDRNQLGRDKINGGLV
jgi:hypothetical protein